ncbi:MAG: DUF294 nucleotidyltransferase-like domain-containing protein, partial [Gammaproteobacteria bacterium]
MEKNKISRERDTVARLEKLLFDQNWLLLSAELTSERLKSFKQSEPATFKKLFEIAHACVAHDLSQQAVAEDSSCLDFFSSVHPIYGSILVELLDITDIDVKIDFYNKAGSIYLTGNQLLQALPYYTRAYLLLYYYPEIITIEKAKLTKQILQRITQIECWLQATIFLNSLHLTAKKHDLTDVITRGFNFFDKLLQSKINCVLLHFFYQCFTPTVNRYLENLANQLQCSVDEDSDLNQFTIIIKQKILVLAEQLNQHKILLADTMLDLKQELSRLITACYTLVYNVIRDRNLTEIDEICDLIQPHQNNLPISTPPLYTATYEELSTDTGTWHQLWQGLAHAEQDLKLDFDSDLPLDTARYTRTVKAIIQRLCERIVTIIGKPSCAFAVIAQGSLARHEALPTSDLDLTILIASDDSDLRDQLASYFDHFLTSLNAWLSLLQGQWVCTANLIESDDVPKYERQSYQYNKLSTGLRIDPMDLNVTVHDNPFFLNTPTELANQVIQFCQTVESLPSVSHRIIANSLLKVCLLYSSEDNAEQLLLDYQVALDQLDMTGSSILTQYYENRLSQYQTELIRFNQLWQRRLTASNDQSIFFIKECLRLLTDWSNAVQDKNIVPYFVTGVRYTRHLLIRLKYQAEVGLKDLSNNWQRFENCFTFVIQPILYTCNYPHTNTYIDPLFDCLMQGFGCRNKSEQEIFEPTNLLNWLLQHQADFVTHEKFYDALLATSTTSFLSGYADAISILPEIDTKPWQTLLDKPDLLGYCQSERLAYQKLTQSLLSMTQNINPEIDGVVLLSWYGYDNQLYQRYLQLNEASQWIEPDSGNIKRHYASSLHRVASIETTSYALHIKQMPTLPLVERGIDILTRRLMSRGTPANLLARLEVNTKKYTISYPILISQTVGQQTQ